MSENSLSRRSFLRGVAVAGAAPLLLHADGAQAVAGPTAQTALEETRKRVADMINDVAGHTTVVDMGGSWLLEWSTRYSGCTIQGDTIQYIRHDSKISHGRECTCDTYTDHTLSAPLTTLYANVSVRKRSQWADTADVVGGDRFYYQVDVRAYSAHAVPIGKEYASRWVVEGKTRKRSFMLGEYVTDEKEKTYSEIEIMFRTEEDANEFAKAMSHLIKLSGGKDDAV